MMKEIIGKLNDLRKTIKLPFVPALWLGFIFWFMLLGALLFSLPAIVIYVLLGLLFLDKLFMLFQFYAALATAKTFNYTLQALVETQMLMEERAQSEMKHRKIQLSEEE
jgi:hypothetical protein